MLHADKVYEFTGMVQGLENSEGYYVEIRDDDGSEAGDTLTYDELDSQGKFSAGWLPDSQQQTYNIFATFEDEFGNRISSQIFYVNVSGQSVLSNETLMVEDVLDENTPFMALVHNNRNKDALNLYVEAKDAYSRMYIPTAVKAISDLSDVLKQKSGNPAAWNFRIFTTVGSPNSIQILKNPPNVRVQLKHEGVVEFPYHG